MKTIVNKLTKPCALFLAVTLVIGYPFLPPASAAEIRAGSGAQASRAVFPDDPAKVAVPETMGEVSQLFKGTSPQTVILVQDAHAIADAQANIQSLIEYFEKEYGLGLIGLEGAASQLDPQIFKSFPDRERLKKVMKETMDSAELVGSVAAAIMSDQAASYHGIEDWDTYEEGIGLFLAADQKREGVAAQLKSVALDLSAKKERLYSPELLEIDRTMESFQDNGSSLMEVLKKLAAVKAPEKGTELEAMLAESAVGGDEQASFDVEIRRGAREVQSALRAKAGSEEGRNSLRAFESQYQQYQTSQVTPQAFMLFLKETAAAAAVEIKASQALHHATARQKKIRDLKGTKFFEDFTAYAKGVKESLFRNDDERRLDEAAASLGLLKQMNDLELDHDGWTRFLSWAAGEGAPLPGIGPEDFQLHKAFYENTEKRDQAFIRNLTALMQGKKEKTALVVAGGFHTEGLTARLKEKNISYLLVMPKIGNVPDKTPYRDQMRGNVSWKSYFEVENGRVSLYKAFVRAMRDKLITDGSTLKQWRDQILRDLAASGSSADPAQYTKFIDEKLTQGKEERLQKDFAVIDRFIDNLKRLDAEGKLDVPNVMQLLKMTTIPAETTSPIVLTSDESRIVAELAGGPVDFVQRASSLIVPAARSEKREAPGRDEQMWSNKANPLYQFREFVFHGTYSSSEYTVYGDRVYNGRSIRSALNGPLHDMLKNIPAGEEDRFVAQLRLGYQEVILKGDQASRFGNYNNGDIAGEIKAELQTLGLQPAEMAVLFALSFREANYNYKRPSYDVGEAIRAIEQYLQSGTTLQTVSITDAVKAQLVSLVQGVISRLPDDLRQLLTLFEAEVSQGAVHANVMTNLLEAIQLPILPSEYYAAWVSEASGGPAAGNAYLSEKANQEEARRAFLAGLAQVVANAEEFAAFRSLVARPEMREQMVSKERVMQISEAVQAMETYASTANIPNYLGWNLEAIQRDIRRVKESLAALLREPGTYVDLQWVLPDVNALADQFFGAFPDVLSDAQKTALGRQGVEFGSAEDRHVGDLLSNLRTTLERETSAAGLFEGYDGTLRVLQSNYGRSGAGRETMDKISALFSAATQSVLGNGFRDQLETLREDTETRGAQYDLARQVLMQLFTDAARARKGLEYTPRILEGGETGYPFDTIEPGGYRRMDGVFGDSLIWNKYSEQPIHFRERFPDGLRLSIDNAQTSVDSVTIGLVDSHGVSSQIKVPVTGEAREIVIRGEDFPFVDLENVQFVTLAASGRQRGTQNTKWNVNWNELDALPSVFFTKVARAETREDLTRSDAGVLFSSGFYGSVNRLARQQFSDDDYGR
ncbi:MAG: hypothetical protein WCU74_08180, partial [Candidatus Omnitrophota bacterium]